MSVCTVEDDFVYEKPRWVARLSNNILVYQDDGRPGLWNESAWIRLKQYCFDEELTLVDLWLQFRSITVGTIPNADGYFFAKSAGKFTFMDGTVHSSVIGYINNDRLYVKNCLLPSLTVLVEEERTLDKIDERHIIWNATISQNIQTEKLHRLNI